MADTRGLVMATSVDPREAREVKFLASPGLKNAFQESARLCGKTMAQAMRECMFFFIVANEEIDKEEQSEDINTDHGGS